MSEVDRMSLQTRPMTEASAERGERGMRERLTQPPRRARTRLSSARSSTSR